MTRTIRDAALAFMLSAFVMVAVLEIGGGAPASMVGDLPSPGVFVGWAVPFTKLLTDVSAVMVIGFLLVAVFLLPSSTDEVLGPSVQAVRIASRWAAIWSAATLALFFLNVSDIFAKPLTELSSPFITEYAKMPAGRAVLLQALGAGLVAVAARWTRGTIALAGILGLALATMAPITRTGHAASTGSHDLATISLLLHVVGVTLWVGGLVALGWVALRGSKRLESATARFSALAVWAFVIVGASGMVNAYVSLGSIDELFGSAYGRLVLLKVIALVVLGSFGYVQRSRIAKQGAGFLRLALIELFIMAATIGLAVALSRTPTPAGSDADHDPMAALFLDETDLAVDPTRRPGSFAPATVAVDIMTKRQRTSV